MRCFPQCLPFSLALLAVSAGAAACAADHAPRSPSVISIVAGDQGYGDFDAHGHPHVKTPALDALHAAGT
ncbi:MAG: hypothetical protein FJ381_11180 [Verrucomicrobia bacterium]|nr:hypothetical protein [Verrucomicrobiota bacterium]